MSDFMQRKILFIAPYPAEDTIKEGYIQRIMNIDNLFHNSQREYVQVRLNPFGKTEKRRVAGVNVYRVNRFRIKKFIDNYQYIYVHSIAMYGCVYKHIKNQITMLDFHGAMPEELAYAHKYFASIYYSFIEKKAAKKVKFIIFVTEVMASHFVKKYPKSKSVIQVYPIIAKNSLVDKKTDINFLKASIKEPVVFVYSGNDQKWQNIPTMINFIKKHDRENYIYIFLSGKMEYFINIINTEFREIKHRFIVDSVLPEELYKFYTIAHYGFLIRDDHLLNRVACPTKMIEYLFYGITPIVKLKQIGDFANYDLIEINDKKINFYPHKSNKNKQLAMEIMKKYDNINLPDMIYSPI
jgi:hypothetical protein